ncbi:hypothetical protein Pcinc_030296 [Petrolisthes cinctipes]|uniref:Uncharacterized protein n=1 Tax=Petrolisthes cinctipes TaxID=88211 RepID=A0AAE1EZ50_PETCI|nr:hypothetical protein Pcinc_030296 [Petrolisthes cinctipes]
MWVELASRPRLGGVGMVYRWCQHSMVGIKSRNPDQESSFTEASPELYSDFFTALRANSSITKISEVSGELRKAVERATSPLFKRAFESVHTVKLDMYIQDIDLLHITTNLTVTIRPQPHRTAPHRTRTRV